MTNEEYDEAYQKGRNDCDNHLNDGADFLSIVQSRHYHPPNDAEEKQAYVRGWQERLREGS